MRAICIPLPPSPHPAATPLRRVAPRFPQCSIKLNRNASESVKYSKEERRKTPNSEFFFITGKSAMLNVLFYPGAWKLLLYTLSLSVVYISYVFCCTMRFSTLFTCLRVHSYSMQMSINAAL